MFQTTNQVIIVRAVNALLPKLPHIYILHHFTWIVWVETPLVKSQRIWNVYWFGWKTHSLSLCARQFAFPRLPESLSLAGMTTPEIMILWISWPYGTMVSRVHCIIRYHWALWVGQSQVGYQPLTSVVSGYPGLQEPRHLRCLDRSFFQVASHSGTGCCCHSCRPM